MNVVFIFSPPWPTWAPNYTIALFESITKVYENVEFRGVDLNVHFYNMVEKEEQYLWDDSCAYEWREKERLAQFDEKYGKKIREFLVPYVDQNTLACAFSVHGNSSLFALFCAEMIKCEFPQIPIVFGGSACFPECHYTRNEILNNPNVDAVFTGEGEISWPAYLTERIKGDPYPLIKGIITKNRASGLISVEEGCIDGGEAEKCKNLDCAYPIDYQSFDLGLYSQRNRYILTTSRGCINRCVFCSESPNYGPFRTRATERVFQEILSIVQLSKERGLTGAPHIGFNDSLMNGNMEKFEKLLDRIIDNKIDIRWETMMAIRKEMTATYRKLEAEFFDNVELLRPFTWENAAFENADLSKPTILFFRDSYTGEGHYFTRYVPEHFGRTILIHYSNLRNFNKYIELYKPDVVVFESAERELQGFFASVNGMPAEIFN